MMMAAAAFSVSCSEGPAEVEMPSSTGSRNVTFTVTTPSDTRGAVVTNDNFNSIKIYCVHTASDNSISTTEGSMSKSSGVWTLANSITLPLGGSTTYYAIGDQTSSENSTGVKFNVDSDGVGSVTYAMPSDVASQPCLLMATPVTIGGDSDDLNVSLSFKYAVSMLGLTTSGEYTIEDLKIKGFTNGADIAFGSSYSTSSYSNISTQSDELSVSLLDATSGSFNYLMLPAQTLEGTVISATLTATKDGVSQELPVTYNLAANSDFETPGYCYTFNLGTGTFIEPEILTPDEDIDEDDDDSTTNTYIVSVALNKTVDPAVTSDPADATISWSSADPTTASVGTDGKITGNKVGSTTITGTTIYGAIIKFAVTVYASIEGQDSAFTIDPTTLAMTVGDSASTVTCSDDGSVDYLEPYTIAWKSSSSTNATVTADTADDTKSSVEAVAAGSATITATITGAISGVTIDKTCAVTVSAAKIYNSNDFTSDSSSNCYMLHPTSEEQVFYIPVEERINRFWGNNGYENVSANTLSETSTWTADLVWYDVDAIGNLGYARATDVTFNNESVNSALKITLPANYNEGNVVIAVKSSTGVVLWSWHLWITAYNPDAIAAANTPVGDGVAAAYSLSGYDGEVHQYGGDAWNSNSSTYFSGYNADKFIMDRNLGARSTAISTSGGGGTGALYYQYGRKDPFSFAGTYLSGYAGTSEDYPYIDGPDPVTSGTAVNNPSTFYSTSSSNWCTSDGSTSYYFWNDVNSPLSLTSDEVSAVVSSSDVGTCQSFSPYLIKSIFDPSPQGWMVAYSLTWSDFTKTNTTTTSNGSRTYSDVAVYCNEGEIKYSSPSYSSSYLEYIWSANPATNTVYGSHFGWSNSISTIYRNNFSDSNNYFSYRTYGHGVRCIQE